MGAQESSVGCAAAAGGWASPSGNKADSAPLIKSGGAKSSTAIQEAGAKARACREKGDDDRALGRAVTPLNRNSVRKKHSHSYTPQPPRRTTSPRASKAGSPLAGPAGLLAGSISSAVAATAPRASKHLDQSIEAEHRIVVIGDLHGMVHKAKALWRVLEDTLTQPQLRRALVVFLGDYCDRGLYTRELLDWLVALKRERDRRGGRTVCLLGNHEFCLLGFLALLPQPVAEPGFLFRQTWEKDASLTNGERERLWGHGMEDAEVMDDIHVQGRRWGGTWYEKSYGSVATFASYHTERGDRDGLHQAMPEEHLDFLRRCAWVHIEDSPLIGRCVFVHAGLEADGSEECGEQLARLQARDARQGQPEALFGRHGVLHTPPQLARRGTTVISGHHGRLLFRTHRVIVDSCAGDEQNPLVAVVLPEMLVVHHNGELDPRDPGQVFPGWSRHKRAGAHAASQGTVASVGSRQVGRHSCKTTADDKSQRWANRMPQGDSSPLEA